MVGVMKIRAPACPLWDQTELFHVEHWSPVPVSSAKTGKPPDLVLVCKEKGPWGRSCSGGARRPGLVLRALGGGADLPPVTPGCPNRQAQFGAEPWPHLPSYETVTTVTPTTRVTVTRSPLIRDCNDRNPVSPHSVTRSLPQPVTPTAP